MVIIYYYIHTPYVGVQVCFSPKRYFDLGFNRHNSGVLPLCLPVLAWVKSRRVVQDDHRTNRVDWLTGYVDLGSRHLIASSDFVGNQVHVDLGGGLSRHVAPGHGPLVVLFGEDGTGQADEGFSVREDPDDVGAPTELLVELFLGVVQPGRW